MHARLTTALSSAALLVAVLGSTPVGQAAGRMILPSNSVGTAQLKPAAVTGTKIKNGTLTAAKFAAGQIPAGPQGDKGDSGAAGPVGPLGAKGYKGDPGATTVTRRVGFGGNAAAGESSVAIAHCLAGETRVGGGASETFASPGKPSVVTDVPNDGGNWYVEIRNDGAGGNVQAYAYILCASP